MGGGPRLRRQKRRELVPQLLAGFPFQRARELGTVLMPVARKPQPLDVRVALGKRHRVVVCDPDRRTTADAALEVGGAVGLSNGLDIVSELGAQQ